MSVNVAAPLPLDQPGVSVSTRWVHPDVLAALVATAEVEAPALAPLFLSLGPIEIAPPRHPTVADQLFTEIVNQQLSIRAGDAIWGRIENAAAERSLRPRDLFQEEHQAILRACGVSANKQKALRMVREADEAGLLDSRELAALEHEARALRLVSIWGIGRWTADMVGIFHFGDDDIWPPGDVAVVGTLCRVTGCADPHQLAECFAPYRSILARYLWRIRDQRPQS